MEVYARTLASVRMYTAMCTTESVWKRIGKIPQLHPRCLGDELSRVRNNNLFVPQKDAFFTAQSKLIGEFKAAHPVRGGIG